MQRIVAEDIKVLCAEAAIYSEVESFYNLVIKIRDVICPKFVSIPIFTPFVLYFKFSSAEDGGSFKIKARQYLFISNNRIKIKPLPGELENSFHF